MVVLVDKNTNYPDSINYIIEFLIGNTMIVTKESLKSSNVPDIVSIKISPEDYKNESKISNKNKLIASYFQNCYHIYNNN